MNWSRRSFLKASGFVLSSIYVESCLQRAWAFTGGESSLGVIPILQTFTNESSAQFRILADTGAPWIYQILDLETQQLLNATVVDRFIHPAWPGKAVDHLFVQGLEKNHRYSLLVRDVATGSVLDERFFQSFDRQKKSARTAMISCMCDDFPDVQKEMWRVVQDSNPDMVFLIGDAVYLDGRNSDDEGGMWRRHLEVRQAFDLFKWKNLKPVISVWDDHDFGINDGGESYPLKQATRQMFEAMFGSNSVPGLERGPSLAQEISFAGQRFFLMDDRYYRTQGVPLGSHWGEEQEEWLFDRLGQSSQPAFLMNGSQYFGGYSGYESFEKEHPDQFSRVLKRLSNTEASTVLVSGDRHFSELMKIERSILGYDSLEITSSSLHSYKPDTVPSAPNPKRLLATVDYNFVLIESEATTAGWDLQINCLGPQSRMLLSHQQIIRR
jgi:hypothetical protein